VTVSFKLKLQDMGHNVDTLEEGVVESFKEAVHGLARAAQAEWIRLAQARLHTSRDAYVQGLRQAESFGKSNIGGQPEYEVQLVGRMANNFEFGMSSFDMKSSRPGWLGGSKAKISKEGFRYAVIPFRHSTGNSPRLQYTGKAVEQNLKQELKKTVKAYGLDRMLKSATGQVIEGAAGRVPSNAPVHPFLQGLTRYQKKNKGKGSSMLMTFRVMSEKSPEDSWIHPGLDGAHLLPEVGRYVDKESERIIDMIMSAA